MIRSKAMLLFLAFLFVLPQQAEARSKEKKKSREKNQPNYQHYEDDDEYRAGKAKRLTGVLLTSIGGSVGGAVLIGGILWNSCIGAADDTLATCKRNAKQTMAIGAVTTALSLGFGIPMITVGKVEMNDAKDRIDRKYPEKESEENGDEASSRRSSGFRLASGGSMFNNYSIAVRVLNLQF